VTGEETLVMGTLGGCRVGVPLLDVILFARGVVTSWLAWDAPQGGENGVASLIETSVVREHIDMGLSADPSPLVVLDGFWPWVSDRLALVTPVISCVAKALIWSRGDPCRGGIPPIASPHLMPRYALATRGTTRCSSEFATKSLYVCPSRAHFTYKEWKAPIGAGSTFAGVAERYETTAVISSITLGVPG